MTKGNKNVGLHLINTFFFTKLEVRRGGREGMVADVVVLVPPHPCVTFYGFYISMLTVNHPTHSKPSLQIHLSPFPTSPVIYIN